MDKEMIFSKFPELCSDLHRTILEHVYHFQEIVHARFQPFSILTLSPVQLLIYFLLELPFSG